MALDSARQSATIGTGLLRFSNTNGRWFSIVGDANRCFSYETLHTYIMYMIQFVNSVMNYSNYH